MGRVNTSERNPYELTVAQQSGCPRLSQELLQRSCGERDDQEKMQDIFYGTEIRTRHSENFIATFSKLIDGAKAVDTDAMVTNALLYGSAAGMLYRVIQHVNGTEPMDPITGLSGNLTAIQEETDSPES